MRKVLAAAIAIGSAFTSPALAGPISVTNAQVRASLGGSTNSAAYMTITNAGGAADQLVGVECACAAKAEIHVTRMSGTMTSMAPSGPVSVPAHGSVVFAPGGRHVMLTGLKAPLVDGHSQPMTLRFAHAGSLRVSFAVRTNITGEPARSGMKGMGGM
jgi:copper(I)-binding protein